MNLMQECITPWGVAAHLISNSQTCAEIYQSALPTEGSSLAEYIRVYGMTYTLEFPVYYFLLRRTLSFKSVLLTNLVVNLATHPIVYLVMPKLFSRWGLNYVQYLIIAEIFAPTIEALLLRFIFRVDWKTAITASICANLFSWSVGVYWNS